MPKETFTPRERWLAVMRRQAPDRVPTDYWGTPETGEQLMRHFSATSLNDALDCLGVDYLITAAPRYAGPAMPPDVDIFGVRHRDVSYGSGVYSEAVSHPLADYTSVEAIEAEYGDVGGVDRLFAVFETLEAKSPHRRPGFFSSHPLTEQRVADLHAYARSRGWRATGPAKPLPATLLPSH